MRYPEHRMQDSTGFVSVRNISFLKICLPFSKVLASVKVVITYRVVIFSVLSIILMELAGNSSLICDILNIVAHNDFSVSHGLGFTVRYW